MIGLSGIVDLHVHGGPSLVPRHALDTQTVDANARAGVALSVLKAHEGSTVERAALCGERAIGGIVLNAPVGGANPAAAEVAGRLGGRIVWMPTISSSTHQAAIRAPELSVLTDVRFSEVPVMDGTTLRDEWYDVFDVIASYDMVLASGHTSCRDALIMFRAARQHGVQRMLLNHPMMPFLGWDQSLAAEFQRLGVRLELGILPDLVLAPGEPGCLSLLDQYPVELLVFGSDLGHAHYPALAEALPIWVRQLETRVGSKGTIDVMTGNGRNLITR